MTLAGRPLSCTVHRSCVFAGADLPAVEAERLPKLSFLGQGLPFEVHPSRKQQQYLFGVVSCVEIISVPKKTGQINSMLTHYVGDAQLDA